MEGNLLCKKRLPHSESQEDMKWEQDIDFMIKQAVWKVRDSSSETEISRVAAPKRPQLQTSDESGKVRQTRIGKPGLHSSKWSSTILVGLVPVCLYPRSGQTGISLFHIFSRVSALCFIQVCFKLTLG